MDSDSQALLSASRDLLRAIDRGDWQAYAELCDQTLSAFEPEAGGHLIEGLEFHKFYFEPRDAQSSGAVRQSSISSPHVRLMGEAAVVTYIRLVQIYANGQHSTAAAEETRVWQKKAGSWKHVHFHRSKPGELS